MINDLQCHLKDNVPHPDIYRTTVKTLMRFTVTDIKLNVIFICIVIC